MCLRRGVGGGEEPGEEFVSQKHAEMHMNEIFGIFFKILTEKRDGQMPCCELITGKAG